MNRLENYKQVHDSVMRGFVREGFVISDTVRFGEPEGGFITVLGQVRCQDDVQIDVDKKLKIVSGTGATALVKTVEYTYNVSTSVGNLFRYDSPHDHRQHHHVHRFDSEGRETAVHELRSVNDVPTLGDVIKEARDDYPPPPSNGEES